MLRAQLNAGDWGWRSAAVRIQAPHPLDFWIRGTNRIHMQLGPVLFEAKLTESDFQTQKPAIVEGYRDVKEIFDCRKLARRGQEYVSYQLLRNVLAAYALKLSFCVLLDARRPDLREQWYAVMSCVRLMDLKTRCKVLTWQELTAALRLKLQRFLELKYGIDPKGDT